VPLVLSSDDLPIVYLDISGFGNNGFTVDTGNVGLSSGSIEDRLLSQLYETKEATSAGITLRMSFLKNSSSNREIARLREISLGDFVHRGVMFARAADNTLGTGYLSRFMITFDFQGRKMYLKPSARFAEPSRHDLSGAHLLRIQGQTRVHSVDAGSAAERAGIKAGDSIITFDKSPVALMSMFDLRKKLCCPGKYALVLKRGKLAAGVALVLTD
jgi:predicted metalloprotease with PDZ domain